MQTRKEEKDHQYENNLTLIDAAKKNQLKIVQMLLKRGANRSFRNKEQLTAIEVAAMEQNWDCVFEFANYKVDNTFAESYNNALLMAIYHNQFNVAYVLLLAGAKPTSHLKKTGNGCLHLAVQNDNPAMINLLYRFGVNFKDINKEGLTPQGLARKLDRYENSIPAFIAKEDFEKERDDLVDELNKYGSHLSSFHRKRATSFVVACLYKAKSTKELIALLALQIDLFKPEYNVCMSDAEIKQLPFHERQPTRRKDEFNKIIEKHYQRLMKKVIEEELIIESKEIVGNLSNKSNSASKEMQGTLLRQFALLSNKEKISEKKNPIVSLDEKLRL